MLSKPAEGRLCFIHGDLWEGIIGAEYETGRIYMYDSAAVEKHGPLSKVQHTVGNEGNTTPKLPTLPLTEQETLSNLGATEKVESSILAAGKRLIQQLPRNRRTLASNRSVRLSLELQRDLRIRSAI